MYRVRWYKRERAATRNRAHSAAPAFTHSGCTDEALCLQHTSLNKSPARIEGIITFMLFVSGFFFHRCRVFFLSTVNVRTYAHSLRFAISFCFYFRSSLPFSHSSSESLSTSTTLLSIYLSLFSPFLQYFFVQRFFSAFFYFHSFYFDLIR